MFTISSLNAALNALVIWIFMPDDVFIIYGLSGVALMRGSRWFYLIYVVIPLLISGSLWFSERFSKRAAETSDEEDETTNAIDEILTGNTLHSDNVGMGFTWFFAIISWVMTGIALNDISTISVIMPSIIVIMLSAVMIFVTSLYSSVSRSSVCGIKLKWLEDNETAQVKTNRFSLYMGLLSGMAGVCLAAWSLVISNNIPNCVAILQLLFFAFGLPILYSRVVCRNSTKSYDKTN